MVKKIPKKYVLPKTFWYIVTGLVILIIGLIAWISYWETGWPQYLAALNKCDGHPPVRVSSFITAGYTLPSDPGYKIPGGADNIGTSGYFCTEAEAKAAGFKHYAY